MPGNQVRTATTSLGPQAPRDQVLSVARSLGPQRPGHQVLSVARSLGPQVPRNPAAMPPRFPEDLTDGSLGSQGPWFLADNWELGTGKPRRLVPRTPGAMAHRAPGWLATMPHRSPRLLDPSTANFPGYLDAKVNCCADDQAPAGTQGPSCPGPRQPIRPRYPGTKVPVTPSSCWDLAASASSTKWVPGRNWSLIELGPLVPWQPCAARNWLNQ